MNEAQPFINSSKRLSVIVVTYNSSEIILQCLEPLVNRVGHDFEIVVVDNASSDGTAELVRATYDEVIVVESKENLGFGRGVRKAIEHATGDIYCLLNPDAVASAAVLEALVERLSDRTIGIVAPLIVQPHGRLRIVSAGDFPTAWRMFTHYSGLSRFGKHLPILRGHYLLPDQVQSHHDVDWVTGACFAIRADTWAEVGGITDRWFMYAEDIELCFKVRRAGYSVILDNELKVSHLVGGSTGASDGVVKSDWIVNLFDFYRTDLAPRPSATATWKIVVSLGLLSRALLFSVRATLSGSKAWRLESRKFFAYARAVANLPRRPSETVVD